MAYLFICLDVCIFKATFAPGSTFIFNTLKSLLKVDHIFECLQGQQFTFFLRLEGNLKGIVSLKPSFEYMTVGIDCQESVISTLII